MQSGDNLKISLGVCVLGRIHWRTRYCVLACDCILENRRSPGLPTDQQQDFMWTNSLLITFSSKSLTLTATYASPGTGCWSICSGLKKSTQVNCTRKHNSSFHGSSQGTELSPTLKKNLHQSPLCQVTHKKEVNHWLLLAFPVWLSFPSFP